MNSLTASATCIIERETTGSAQQRHSVSGIRKIRARLQQFV